jgi:DNA (cytosine-5)-methyltransferase 1
MSNPMARFRTISLFTGAGGLDYGLEAAGFELATAVEIDRNCLKTLRASRPHWPTIDRSVAAVSAGELLEAAGLEVGEAALLAGGPPCQPFSKAGFWANGDSARLNDPRASTLDHYLRLLEGTLPEAFLLENVEGLGFRGKQEGLALVREGIASVNRRKGTRYGCSIAVLDAADFGVPQHRRRLFIIGSREGREFRFPEPSHGDDATATLTSRRTAWDALHDLPEPNDPALVMKGKWAGLMPSIPEGYNYLWHTERGGGEPLFGWRRRFWSFLLKLAKDRPAWTLAAQPGPATGPFHWSGRRLSVREMARLQTFPDDVIIHGTLADAQRQLGNAVPSLLAEILGRAIRVQLLAAPALEGPLQLVVNEAPLPPPPPRPPEPTAAEYATLAGRHPPHPGTGQGYRAERRRLNGILPLAAE